MAHSAEAKYWSRPWALTMNEFGTTEPVERIERECEDGTWEEISPPFNLKANQRVRYWTVPPHRKA